MIKIHEGCLLHSYLDGEHYAIGYGHHEPGIEEGMTITQWRADQYLKKDIAWVNRELNHIIPECFGDKEVEIPQVLLDAIGDMVFRCGGTTMRESEFYKRLMQCRVKDGQIIMEDYIFTAAAVRDYNVSNLGTQNRQKHLYTLLIDKIYPVGKVNYEIFVAPVDSIEPATVIPEFEENSK